MFGFKACSVRTPITSERFIEYMKNNDYFVASRFETFSGSEKATYNSTDGIVATNDAYRISIDFLQFESPEAARNEYYILCKNVRESCFTNHELLMLTYKSDYVDENHGDNYDRYIIRNPDRNLNYIISRIEDTIIFVYEVPDLNMNKVKDSLGHIGY